MEENNFESRTISYTFEKSTSDDYKLTAPLEISEFSNIRSGYLMPRFALLGPLPQLEVTSSNPNVLVSSIWADKDISTLDALNKGIISIKTLSRSAYIRET